MRKSGDISFDDLYETELLFERFVNSPHPLPKISSEQANQLVQMMSLDQQVEHYQELKSAGAKVDINLLLEQVEPYTALQYFYDFVDNGADINRLAERLFEDEAFDVFFEDDVIDELLENGANPEKLFELCRPAIQNNEDDEEVNTFINHFRGYLPNNVLKQFLR